MTAVFTTTIPSETADRAADKHPFSGVYWANFAAPEWRGGRDGQKVTVYDVLTAEGLPLSQISTTDAAFARSFRAWFATQR